MDRREETTTPKTTPDPVDQPGTLPTTIPALLRAARGELDRRGWTQHDFEAPTGEVCLLAALNAPLTEDPQDEPATPDAQWLLVAAVDTLVQRFAPTDPAHAEADYEDYDDLVFDLFGEIAAWNDAAGRTLTQVIALLETTTAELEATGETSPTTGCIPPTALPRPANDHRSAALRNLRPAGQERCRRRRPTDLPPLDRTPRPQGLGLLRTPGAGPVDAIAAPGRELPATPSAHRTA